MAMKVKIFEFYLTPKTNNSPSFEEPELNNFMKDKEVSCFMKQIGCCHAM